MSGRRLGGCAPEVLAETRLHVHHALQALTGFAQSLVEPMEDDMHRNFDWDVGVRGFRTRPAVGAPDVTAVLALPEFELRLERSDAVLARIPAQGVGGRRLREQLEAACREEIPGASDRARFEPPEFDLPDHAVADGETPFEPDSDALVELGAWLTHADLALLRVHDDFEGVCDEIRVWPHHFDLATLLEAESGTIGLGLSPGDGGTPHPYWYVRGYPKEEPREGDLPELPHGAWKFEGWTGAILEAPEIAALGDADAQRTAVDAFLDVAIDTCVRLLG